MTATEFVKSLGIETEGTETDDKSCVVTLSGSNEFSRIYTKLDKAEDIDLDVDEMIMSPENILMTYLTDDFDIILKADLKNNVYTLEVKEISL